MSRLPTARALWLFGFAGTAGAVLATAIPVLGLLFVMLGAPLWPILLLNMAFGAMALDAWASRSWLLMGPPLAWFGGYGVVAAISHAQVDRLRDVVAAGNRRPVATWDRSTQPVFVHRPGTDSEFWASDIRPDMLVLKYGLGRAYAGNAIDTESQEVSLQRAVCDQGPAIVQGIELGPIWRGGYPVRTPRQRADGVCIVYRRVTSPPPASLSITLAPARKLTGLVAGIDQAITISGPNQPPFTVRAVQVAPLPWWPMPIIGCGYRGGIDIHVDTGCHAEFRFTSWRGQEEAQPVAVAARALGLTAMSLEQRLPGVVWR